MSNFQARTYIQAEYKESKGAKKSRTGGIRKAARHASNFVFPKEVYMERGVPTFDEEVVGRFGSDGFNKFVVFENNKYRFEKNFSTIMDEESNLATFSEKFLNVISLCDSDPGSCFCYTDDFAKASGAILLGLCFEKYGYKRFDTNAPAFKITAVKQTKDQQSSVFCKKGNDENVERRITVNPDKRYAILTSESDKETIRNILTLFNSRENVNGEYIKVIIASRKAREGLNLANVQNIHLISPSWNQANMYQAMFRAIRATSHIEILKMLKEEALLEGKTQNQIDKIRVKVRVYQHCSVPPDDEEIRNLSEELLGDPDVSVELQMYQLSEQKDRNNALVMRMLKQCAIDCQINKLRNARRPSDKDGTTVCNYMSCDYDCVNPPPKSIDYTTYDVYYKDELVENIKKELVRLFDQKNTYNASEIFESISNYPTKFVLQGLAEMIKNKTTFVNRYGYTSFLDEDGDKFFLVNELNAYATDTIIDTKRLSGKMEYNENLYAVGRKTFDETIRQIRYPTDQKEADKLAKASDLLDKVETLDPNVLINLIENILVKKFKKEDLTQNEKNVLKKYDNLIFELNEPITLLIEKQQERSEPVKPKRGRTKDLTKAAKVKNIKKKQIDLEDAEFGDVVLVHILDLLRNEKSGFRTTAKFQKADANIRIYKPVEDKWRDTTEVEKLAYNTLIQMAKNSKFEELFSGEDIYGTILQDKKFRIVDKTKESKKKTKGRQTESKGQECTSPTFQKITDLLFKLNLTPSDFEIPLVKEYPKDEQGLQKFLVKEKEFKTEEMSKEEILFAAKWVATGLKKDGLCKYIQQYFDANNLLYKLV
jgi:hypothetical protein